MKLNIKKAVEEYPNNTGTNPLVSVSVVTYRHVNYIRQCLDGILMQKTNFEFEILLGEDASTDGTREMCVEYAKKHPDKIRLFLHHRENVIHINGRPVGRFNFLYNLQKARGAYIALTEGDDYWTDPDKLQKQVDFLEKNEDVAGCFHNSIVVDENGRKIKDAHFREKKTNGKLKTYFSQEECLTNLRSSYPTCSLMFRSSALRDIDNWPMEAMSDYTLDLIITEHGYLCYLPESMAAYRIHSGGIWQGTSDYERGVMWQKRYKALYLKKDFRNKYEKYIRSEILNKRFYTKSIKSKFQYLQNYIKYKCLK